jgi:hypothetical protein
MDAYARNRSTGSFVLVDRGNNATVAAGMLLAVEADAGDAAGDPGAVRAKLLGHRGAVLAVGTDPARLQAVQTTLLGRGVAAIALPAAAKDLAGVIAEQGQVVLLPVEDAPGAIRVGAGDEIPRIA